MNRNRETIVNLASNIVSFVVSILIGFFLSPYIIRHLGAEANGFTQLANNFVSYASLITIALNSVAGRFMSIEYHRGNYGEVRKYYTSVIVGNVIIGILLGLVAIGVVWKLDHLINIGESNVNDVKLLFALVFGNFLISQISSVFYTATYVANKLYYQNLVTLFNAVFRACVLIALFGFFKPRMFYVSFAGFLLGGLSVPISFYIKRKLLPEIRFEKSSFSLKYIITLISSGIWNTVNQCGNILMTGLDLLLANLFITPYDMGILATAKTIPTYIVQLGVMINMNFAPNLTISYATSDKKEVLHNLRWSMKVSSVMMSIPLGIISIFGSEFYRLWVPSLDAGKLTALSVLTCLAFVLFSGPQVLYNVYTTTNKLKLNSVTVVLGGIINFVAVYFLLRHTNLGIYAIAGTSSVISIIRNLIITVPYTAHLLKLKWYEFYKDVGLSFLCYIVVCLVALVVKYVFSGGTWILLAISVILASIVSFLIQILMLLKGTERRLLLEKLLRRKNKNG